jgi:tRNA threonylcarbamoyl adenosine modification protein (Sua5/YciO/YrdC/YwlC family)
LPAVSRSYDCTDRTERTRGIDAAVRAVRRGNLVVIPTDTVYGMGCDAFNSDAVAALLAAKGRGRDMPLPVLVGSPATLAGISAQSGGVVSELVEAFWPGGLTLVCRQQPSLDWDLGDARGTVAVRMPLHPVAIEVLRETGPMAVSSANRSGQPPARSGGQAREQLGDAVAIYLDSYPTDDDVPSTIVDVTGDSPRVLRAGAVSLEVLQEVVPETTGATASP